MSKILSWLLNSSFPPAVFCYIFGPQKKMSLFPRMARPFFCAGSWGDPIEQEGPAQELRTFPAASFLKVKQTKRSTRADVAVCGKMGDETSRWELLKAKGFLRIPGFLHGILGLWGCLQQKKIWEDRHLERIAAMGSPLGRSKPRTCPNPLDL